MLERRLGSMITVAIAAAAVGAIISMSITRTLGSDAAGAHSHAWAASRISAASGKRTTKPTGICRRTRRCLDAVTQQGVYPYDYARVPARRFSRWVRPAPCRDRSVSCRETGRFRTSSEAC